jgi:hypothetical protein
MEETALHKLLEQINGIYIPGDTKQSYLNTEYQYQIMSILAWAQNHNSDLGGDQHFPVVAVGYGLPAML